MKRINFILLIGITLISCNPEEGETVTPDTSQGIIYNNENSLERIAPIDIEFEEEEKVWMVSYSNRRLVYFDGISWTAFLPDESIEYINDVTIDNRNDKWVSTPDNGIAKFDNDNWTYFNTDNSDIPSNQTYGIVADRYGGIWVGTDSGIAMLKNNEWKVYNTVNSDLTSNFISAIELNTNGDIWFATTKELVQLTGDNLKINPFPEIHGSKAPKSLAILSSNEIWMDSHSSLLTFKDGLWNHKNSQDESNCLNDCDISDLIFAKNELWLAYNNTWSDCDVDGLWNYNTCTYKEVYLLNDFQKSGILTIATSPEGKIWAGSINGILVFQP
jgi:ligand-binding sensor domain-containing protein